MECLSDVRTGAVVCDMDMAVLGMMIGRRKVANDQNNCILFIAIMNNDDSNCKEQLIR